MRFEQPIYLLLLIPALLGLIFSFRYVHGMAKGRKKVAFVIRFLLAGLLVGALAGPESYRENEGLGVVFVVDRSASIQDADRVQGDQFVDNALKSLKPTDAAGVVVFGADARVESAPGGRRSLGKVASEVDQSG